MRTEVRWLSRGRVVLKMRYELLTFQNEHDNGTLSYCFWQMSRGLPDWLILQITWIFWNLKLQGPDSNAVKW